MDDGDIMIMDVPLRRTQNWLQSLQPRP